jgi:transglutaminase-like putative cysteine protease
VLFCLFFPGASFAKDFSTGLTASFTVQEQEATSVKLLFSLINETTNLYATTYTVSLIGVSPQNISVTQGSTPIPFTTEEKDKETFVHISFPDAVLGKGSSRTFSVTYDTRDLAQKNGEIWEVTIPKIDDTQFDHFTLYLFVPSSFHVAYISPKPVSQETKGKSTVYEFSSKDVSVPGVVATFGAFQVFSFSLTYALQNPLAYSSTQTIALPPDTSYQRMYYSSMEPKPDSMSQDSDGNWLALYKLAPKQEITVHTKGSVQLFASSTKKTRLSPQEKASYLTATQYWQVDDPKIREISSKLQTPRDVYDYVVSTLSYDYSRVKPNVERLGAVKALEAPKTAICMEFTDLFVTLARAIGIPAREVNGYAYTQNPDIEPLSLVSDVLHSWPEYYDEHREMWIPVDPTWADTTGGVDFFDTFDFRHFSFVIHGKDSVFPYPAGSYKLGSTPTKDVEVTFGTLPAETTSTPSIMSKYFSTIPLLGEHVAFTVVNPGPVALYDTQYRIAFDSHTVLDSHVPVLLPFGSYTTQQSLPIGAFGLGLPKSISFAIGSSHVVTKPPVTRILMESLAVLFVLVFSLVGFVYSRIHHAKA